MKSDRKMTALFAVFLCLAVAGNAGAASGTGQGDGKGSFHFEMSQTVDVTENTDKLTAAANETAETAATETEPSSPVRERINSEPTTSRDTGTGAMKETVDGVTYYIFDGKRYIVEQDWGIHNLTGFSPFATGGIQTRSGKNAQSDYTAASTQANLGKVILVQAENGTGSCGNIHRYDGIYKCEDTGGAAVEYGTENTGYVPVVDLFFDTETAAGRVSGSGWIEARIFILKEVQ